MFRKAIAVCCIDIAMVNHIERAIDVYIQVLSVRSVATQKDRQDELEAWPNRPINNKHTNKPKHQQQNLSTRLYFVLLRLALPLSPFLCAPRVAPSFS